jgi:hypothetical protein
MGLADLGSLAHASGIGKAARGFKVRLQGGRWSARGWKLQSTVRTEVWLGNSVGLERGWNGRSLYEPG